MHVCVCACASLCTCIRKHTRPGVFNASACIEYICICVCVCVRVCLRKPMYKTRTCLCFYTYWCISTHANRHIYGRIMWACMRKLICIRWLRSTSPTNRLPKRSLFYAAPTSHGSNMENHIRTSDLTKNLYRSAPKPLAAAVSSLLTSPLGGAPRRADTSTNGAAESNLDLWRRVYFRVFFWPYHGRGRATASLLRKYLGGYVGLSKEWWNSWRVEVV